MKKCRYRLQNLLAITAHLYKMDGLEGSYAGYVFGQNIEVRMSSMYILTNVDRPRLQ